ncbi:hypothetical protein [uncultured Maricaulis sp.]|uniref:hypothetical protein n=1 Tax=uncultured Maricaulis sp. TaxID=174710 RepID=UPI00260CE8D4|nr:hypothetical protein [uncultured Maricaulis sp.]
MLRTMTAILALGALSTPSLADQPVTIGEIAYGPELIENAEDFGERELERLSGYLRTALERELRDQMGEGGYTLNATILNAQPNRPTMAQMSGTRALHHSSISIGGAEVEAELISADGEILETYSYGWQSWNIQDVTGYAQWTDARRTFSRFADQVSDSLDERADTGS